MPNSVLIKESKRLRKLRKVNDDKYHGYFEGHECTTQFTNEYEIKYNPWRKLIFVLFSVRSHDPRTRHVYRSYASICAEKRRQYMLYPFTIHPFSTFRLTVEIVVTVLLLTSHTIIPIIYSARDPQKMIQLDLVKDAIEVVYLINIVVNFFTGYVEGNTSKFVVFDLKRIFFRYLKTFFFIDMLVAMADIHISIQNPPIITTLSVSVKLLRLPILYTYICNIRDYMNLGIIFREIVEFCFLVHTYLTWNIFFQFAEIYLYEGEYLPANPLQCAWISVGDLWNESHSIRFIYAFDRAVAMLRENSNVNIMTKKKCSEYFYVVTWTISRLLTLHCTMKYVLVLFGRESARAKFYVMSQQVKSYMDQNRFPPRIKKKILKFYAIRFQSNFFVESRMMACLSGQLREDIIMHTGRQLVSNVEFLKQLPRALLMQIGLKLDIVIFIGGDIIFKINTIGDCLYFIDKGTVAIYSETGKEICHLEDGDFFGEIALIMKHRFRTASAVAVTNCELFRLDREDFEKSIACYPTVYEDIKRVAMERFERMTVLDEHHKSEMKMEAERTPRKSF